MKNYRSDIDGLRALAVLPILLFHAGIDVIPGGFIGVDIFFVISGYLITAILIKENTNNSFSIVTFYERRARRIFPALIFVVTTTLLAGFFMLLPDEYIHLSQSAWASLFFIPNIFFWDTRGYFGIDAATTPLLHTWSLGVEEQFYFCFPWLLFILWRYFNHILLNAALLILAFASFAYNISTVTADATFTFYMLPTRAWELLIGAMIATGFIRGSKHTAIDNALSLVGLTLVILGLFTITEQSIFPGYLALYPTIGTALIIASGESSYTWLAKFLSLKPLRYIGLISYSLYLWHWPVAVYLRMFQNSNSTPLLIIATSFVLASISYHLIEQPIRTKQLLAERKRLFVSLALMTLAPALFAGVIYWLHGFPDRIPAHIQQFVKEQDLMHAERHCHGRKIKQLKAGDYCTFGDPKAKPTFALIGDSHADALRPALETAAKLNGQSGIQLTTHGCRPLKGVHNYKKRRCKKFIDTALDIITNNQNIEHIFLVGYWRVSYTGSSYRYKNIVIVDEDSPYSTVENNPNIFTRGLVRTVEQLAGRKIYFVGDVPDVKLNVRKLHARSLFLNTTGLEHTVKAEDPLNPVLEKLVATNFADKLTYIDLQRKLCPDSYCYLFIDNQLVYRDGDHLSRYGAEHLTDLFEPILNKDSSQFKKL